MSSLVSRIVRVIEEAIRKSAEETKTGVDSWRVEEFEVCIRIPNDVGWIPFLDRLEEFLRNEYIDDDRIEIRVVPKVNAGEYGWITKEELEDLKVEMMEAYAKMK